MLLQCLCVLDSLEGCDEGSTTCNCDIGDENWRTDVGNFTTKETVGITSLYFLQPEEKDPDSNGALTLGNLKCVKPRK